MMGYDKERYKEIMRTTAPWYVESQMGELTPEDHAFLKRNSTVQHYPAGTLIYDYGTLITKLNYINKGTVRYNLTSSEGEMKTVFFTDRFLALECFLHGQPAQTNAMAIDDVEIFALPQELADEALARKSIRDLAFKALSIKCRILGWQVDDLSLSKPLGKVCRLLCCYMTSDEGHYRIHLTHQELADLTGLHRVTVTNNMSQLRKMKVIEMDGEGQIVVLDWEKLKELGFDGCL